MTFCAILKYTTLQVKTAVATFGATFGKFCCIVLSHLVGEMPFPRIRRTWRNKFVFWPGSKLMIRSPSAILLRPWQELLWAIVNPLPWWVGWNKKHCSFWKYYGGKWLKAPGHIDNFNRPYWHVFLRIGELIFYLKMKQNLQTLAAGINCIKKILASWCWALWFLLDMLNKSA